MLFNKLNFFFGLVIISGSSLLNSCHNDDNYSLDNFAISLATVNPLEGKQNLYYLTLDDGTSMWPVESLVEYNNLRQNQRVFLNYTVLTDTQNEYHKSIRINNITDILTKNIIKQDSINDFGSDPIKIISTWIGDNYLNFRFKIKVGGESRHAVDVVYNSLKNLSEDTIRLEFRHNAFGDPERYEEITYAAFNFQPLQPLLTEKSVIVVESTDYKNEKHEFILKYDIKNQASND